MSALANLRKLAADAAAHRDTELEVRKRDDVAEHRVHVISCAVHAAQNALGEEAAGHLTWVFQEFGPHELFAADAWLNDQTRLRYQYDDNAETAWFGLVRECPECGHEQRDPVTELADLARLLDEISGDTE